MPGTWPGRPGRAAPPPSSPGPARSWTRWSSGPRSSAPTSPRSPTPSSPSTNQMTVGAYRQRPPHQPDNDAGGGRQASSEGAPDARPPVTGQHGQADGDLNQTDDALEDDVPGRDIGGQDAGQLQDRHWHAQHPGEEGHQSDERGQRG